MAKKKKNDLDENDDINEGRSDDINEADDNFGLPDVDYTPVEEEETTRRPEEEPVAEEETTRDLEEEPIAVERTGHSETESSSEPAYEPSAADESASTSETTSTYEPGSYRPPKEESNAPKIIILIAVILLVGAGIWYFGFYSPQQKAEQARIEQEQREAEEAQLAEDRRQEEERQRQLEAQREAERLAAEEEAAAQQEPQEGSFEILSSRTGNYYVVVSSSLDADLATDFGRRLAQEGLNTKLLEPTGNNKFHRVAVAGFDSWASAQEKADELKSRFGENVWVVKY